MTDKDIKELVDLLAEKAGDCMEYSDFHEALFKESATSLITAALDGQWVKVEDATLIKNTGYNITMRSNITGVVSVDHAEYKRGKWWWGGYMITNSVITHVQPLPPPPKPQQ